jgi:hypothetical protein
VSIYIYIYIRANLMSCEDFCGSGDEGRGFEMRQRNEKKKSKEEKGVEKGNDEQKCAEGRTITC